MVKVLKGKQFRILDEHCMPLRINCHPSEVVAGVNLHATRVDWNAALHGEKALVVSCYLEIAVRGHFACTVADNKL